MRPALCLLKKSASDNRPVATARGSVTYGGAGVEHRVMLRLTLQMITQAFDILDFNALRALVRRGAQTDTGRERIDRLGPISDIDELQRDLGGVAEMIE